MDTLTFNAKMRVLPEPPNPPPPYWDHWRHDLWERGQAGDPAHFMSWPCIHHTMLVGFRDMRHRWDDLGQRYRRIVKELPPPLFENAIEQAYHLSQWEARVGRRVEDLDTIFELGGGYGQMAWLCRKLGFKGRYIISDVAEFLLLQNWWLGSQGINDILYEFMGYPYRVPDLYIGIYSVSVMPPEERERALIPAVSYLLAYSSEMAEYQNWAWFAEWMEQTGREWQTWQMPDRPEDWYAVC